MNNQELIDKAKLLGWIDGNWEMERTAGTRESGVRAEMWHEFYHKVVSGDFAPDTPPVPTIKPGDKVRHTKYGHGDVKKISAWVWFSDGPEYKAITPGDLEVVE